MSPRKFPAAPVVVIIIGLISFGNVSRNPRFDSYRAVDVVQLLASGMCLGVAFATLMARRRMSTMTRK